MAPGGIPHCLTQDDHYEGYFLPKGTIVFANTWSIHQDDSEYDQPSQFKPERFLNNKFGTKSNESVAYNDRRVTYAFGAGRRVCQGQRLAESSLVGIRNHHVYSRTLADTNVDAYDGEDRMGIRHLCRSNEPGRFQH